MNDYYYGASDEQKTRERLLKGRLETTIDPNSKVAQNAEGKDTL